MSVLKRGSLGDILSASRIIAETDIAAALEEQKQSGLRFGEALIRLGIVTQEDIDWALSNQLDIPYVRLHSDGIDRDAVSLVPASLARSGSLIPLIRAGSELNIAISDPLNHTAIAAVEKASGCTVNVSVALTREISEMIDHFYGPAVVEQPWFSSAFFDRETIDAVTADPRGGRLLEYLLGYLLENRLSSLSFQPLGDTVAVCGRQSGRLLRLGELAGSRYHDIARKIRTDAGVPAGETPTAEGVLTSGHHSLLVRCRVSVTTASGGDLITIRPHPDAGFPLQLTDLGLSEPRKAAFAGLAGLRSGLTLFAAADSGERSRLMDLMLEEMETEGRSVIILGESPGGLNKRFPRIRFPRGEAERAQAVTGVLEHAPDVLVVEDITGPGVFSTVCRAAMGGRLVLAGFESRDIRDALDLLLQYYRSKCFLPLFVNGVVASKGIRLLCPECRAEYRPPPGELAAMELLQPPSAFYRSAGCERCRYSGSDSRRLLLDVMAFDDDLRDMFGQAAAGAGLETYPDRSGSAGIRGEALRLLMDGMVSPEEYLAAVVM